MKHLFVPYEIALLAKEKGFDERCVACYYRWGDKSEHYICGEGNANSQKQILNGRRIECLSPLYQQLIDWFREKYDIEINRVPSASSNLFIVYVKSKPINTKSFTDEKYYEALNKAFEQAFKLI